MKSCKRITALLLALILLLPGAQMFMAGASESPYMHFDSIFSIGDSNCMGYGLDGYKGGRFDETGRLIEETEFTNKEAYLHGVPDSYTDLVRSQLGLERTDCSVLNYPAFRVTDALYYLDAGEADDFFEYCYDIRYMYSDIDAFGDDCAYDPTGTLNDQSKSVFIESAKGDNKLIIDQVGSSDLFYSLIEQSLSELFTTDDISAYVQKAIDRLWNAHADFDEEYPKLIERLQELNPNATIVLVGMFNPFEDLYVTDCSVIPFFNAFRLVISQINKEIQAFAKQYGCKYADISNAETDTTSEEITIQKVLTGEVFYERAFHLSREGHKYVARQILETLRTEPEDHQNNIVVDMGRFEKVDYVTVDGLPVNYRMDGRVLTVPNRRTTAKLLTVGIQNSDGSISLLLYQLSYDHGYKACRIYGTNDLVSTVTKPFLYVPNSIKLVSDLLNGLK